MLAIIIWLGIQGHLQKTGNFIAEGLKILRGAHASGYNLNSLGVCLIGNFNRVMPSEKQFEALFSFLEEKINQYKIPIKNVIGHSEIPGVDKSCPGRLLNMSYVRAIISGQENFSASRYAFTFDEAFGISSI